MKRMPFDLSGLIGVFGPSFDEQHAATSVEAQILLADTMRLAWLTDSCGLRRQR